MIALIYAFGALSALALLLEVIARATPAAVAQMPKVREARERYEAVQAKANLAVAEISRLKHQRDALADEVMLVEARLKDAKRRAIAQAAGRPIFVIEVGKNAPDRKLYEAYISNAALRSGHRSANTDRINVIFATPQLIEVWAEGLVEARHMLDRQFPREDGYEVEYTDQMIDSVQQAG